MLSLINDNECSFPQGYVSARILPSAAHFRGRRAGRGLPDLKTSLEVGDDGALLDGGRGPVVRVVVPLDNVERGSQIPKIMWVHLMNYRVL